MTAIDLRIMLRPEQQRLWSMATRFQVPVCSRRLGKSTYAQFRIIHAALTKGGNGWYSHYGAPSQKQAKGIAFDSFYQMTREIPGMQVNRADLEFTFPNGAKTNLVGMGDNADSLRGLKSHLMVVDEAAWVPTQVWEKILRPMLLDTKGSAIISGSVNGKNNLLRSAYEWATSGVDPEWSSIVIPATDAPSLDPKELEAIRKTISASAWRQEFLCDWDVAIAGAYWGAEMTRAHERGRITTVEYDPNLPVYVALDLGVNDLFVALFVQTTGTEHRFIDTRAYTHSKISDIIHDWRSLEFPITQVIAPHDIEVFEMTAGAKRKDVFAQNGCDVKVVPRVKSKHESIAQAQDLIQHCFFDAKRCQMLTEAMSQYRAGFDEKNQVAQVTPQRGWWTHYADAFQTYALGRPDNFNTWDDFDFNAIQRDIRRSLRA